MLIYLLVNCAFAPLFSAKFPKAILIFILFIGLCFVNFTLLCDRYIVKSSNASNASNASNDPNILYKFKKTFR